MPCVSPPPLHPVSYLSSSDHLLGRVHRLAAARAPVRPPDFLGHSGGVGVGGSVGLAPVERREGIIRAGIIRPSRNTPESTSPTGTPWDRAESSAPRCHQELGYAGLLPAPWAQGPAGGSQLAPGWFQPQGEGRRLHGVGVPGEQGAPSTLQVRVCWLGFSGLHNQAPRLDRCEGKKTCAHNSPGFKTRLQLTLHI